jgi:uncharacterized protein (DUF488 family)
MTIYTIGHSNLPIERLIELLREHQIEILVDVRSYPYSAHNPQFNQEALQRSVENVGVGYRFAGHSLGGKPADPELRSVEGIPDYDRIAATAPYREGIGDLIALASVGRVAVMCSEADPATCHREKLIARTLREQDVEVLHIYSDGSVSAGTQPALW